ncbi:Hypothetical predicted protein, partial [Paramuricea clavata]
FYVRYIANGIGVTCKSRNSETRSIRNRKYGNTVIGNSVVIGNRKHGNRKHGNRKHEENRTLKMSKRAMLLNGNADRLETRKHGNRKHGNRKHGNRREQDFGDVEASNAAKRQCGSIVLLLPLGLRNVKGGGRLFSILCADLLLQHPANALQAIFNHASQTSGTTVIYFPAGKYLITSNLIIKGRVTLMGSVDGISLFRTENTSALLTTINYEGIAAHDYLDIDRLFFDGVQLEFRQDQITISHCVFFSNETPSPKADKAWLRKGQSFCFLRDERGFGIAVDVQSSVAIKIEKNIFGLDLGRIDWMDNELGTTYWPTLKRKLQFLKNELNLCDDQGFWKSSIYHGFNNDSAIEKNIFNGSPNYVRNGSFQHKDHAVYLKAFHNLNFTENYVRGWDPDSSGGIKARNGEGLVIARNYVDDTGILLYIHKQVGRPLPLFLKNVLVYGNHIVERTKPGHRKSGIFYLEPHQNFTDENLVYAGNVFEIEGANPTSKDCIFIGKHANLNQHHVYDDNIYEGTTPPERVQIKVVHETLKFQSGSAPVPRDYVAMTVPR